MNMSDENENSVDGGAHDENQAPNTSSKDQLDNSGLTAQLLDDIIERLINYEKYPGYTINEIKGSSSGKLPYILKEKEIRMLISGAEAIFKE